MPDLILASGSAARARMLAGACVPFRVETAAIDEAEVKSALLAEGASPRDIADKLAELKAWRVARRHPGALVLGADQVLDHQGRLYDKPRDLAEARAQLLALRDSTHQLLSAAVIFEAGEPVWRHVGVARMTVRDFGDDFLDRYLAAGDDDLLTTVGCYRIEAEGVQLFSGIAGDYFSILGLPLIQVLAFLRSRGVIET